MATTPIGTNFVYRVINVGAIKEIVAPAQNVGGIIVRSACLSASGGDVQLVAGTVNPGNQYGKAPGLLSCSGGQNGPANVVLPYDIKIPAGHGLWVVQGGSTTVNGRLDATYELLPVA